MVTEVPQTAIQMGKIFSVRNTVLLRITTKVETLTDRI